MSTDNPYASPQFADQAVVAPQSEEMSALWILFSFEGRIPRRVYWGAMLGAFFLFYAFVFALFSLLGEESPIAGLVTLVLYVPMLWLSLAVTVKRWHDRGKSGWWVFIGAVPIIGPIWSFIETGCLRGTEGPNKYGLDPT